MGDLNLKDALVNLGGSVSLYRTLVQGFKDKYSNIDDDIKSQLLKYDIEDARRLAHSMKGLSGNLGASELQNCSRLLEEVIKSYIGSEILEDEINAILGKEWIMFSDELVLIRKHIDLVLSVSDDELLLVENASELDKGDSATEDGLSEIDKYTKQLLLSESKSSIQTLIRTLNTYNYESINKAIESQDEELLKRCCSERWDKIMMYINDFEYDKAKEEILEGVLDEE